MAVPAAHIGVEKGLRTGRGGSLDRQTKLCLGCHDGVSARESGNTTPWNRGHSYTGDPRRSHPIGVAYPGVASRASASRFNPAGFLPERMRLPNGNVGCVSCHDLYGREEHLLTVPIKGSALCFTCHDLD